MTRCTSEGRRAECAGWRRKRARGKGCVKLLKTALCASEPGACGAQWPAAAADRRSSGERPMSSGSEGNPVVGADPPDEELALKKPQGLQEMEGLTSVRLVHRRGLSEAR